MKLKCLVNHRLNDRGFTILEVLIATIILGGGIMVTANAWSGNFMRIRNSRINNTMAVLLERKMTEFEVMTKEKALTDFPESDAGEFGARFPGYRWTMKTQPFEMPNLTATLTAKEGGVDEMTLTLVHTMTDYIKDVVKEMAVTVYYKARNGREIKAAASFYLIDYTKDIPLPGMGGGTGGAAGATGAPATTAPATGAASGH